MADAQAKIVMLGMPETGKSTFMTSLFMVLEAQRVKTRLRLASYAGDRTYVNRLADRLRDMKSLEHTLFGAEDELTLELEDEGGRSFALTLPDYSGETLERALTRRGLLERVAHAIEESDGLILFLHPDTIDPGTSVADAEQILAALGARTPEAEKTRESKDWSNQLARTDVQMVDALQELLASTRPGLRISVVVSAWDVARVAANDPETWLEREMPLFTQFLANNPDRLTSRIFGVSAQGGSYVTDRDQLLDKEISARTIVVGEGCEPHDLSAVIAWLLDDEADDAA
jgi:hypothetical protein